MTNLSSIVEMLAKQALGNNQSQSQQRSSQQGDWQIFLDQYWVISIMPVSKTRIQISSIKTHNSKTSKMV